MSMLERDLLAAKCPVPNTRSQAQRLHTLFRQQCIYFAWDVERLLLHAWNTDEVRQMFETRWGIASIYQREAIFVATYLLSGENK